MELASSALEVDHHEEEAKTRLIWHRRDLRLSDNELYDYADGPIVSCYIIPHQQDDFQLRTTTAQQQLPAGGSSVMMIHGAHYCRVLMDALTELRSNLQASLGSNLLVRRGPLHEILVQLCHELDVDQVAWSEEPGYYEQQASERVKKALLLFNMKRKQNHRPPIRIHTTCTYTLFHSDDLPHEEHVWMALARPKETRRKTNQKRQSQEPPILAAAIDHTATDDSSPHSMVDTSREKAGMPRIMGDFRRAARSHAQIRKPMRSIGELQSVCQMTETTTAIHLKIL